MKLTEAKTEARKKYNETGEIRYIIYDNTADYLAKNDRYFETGEAGLDNYFAGIEPIEAVG